MDNNNLSAVLEAILFIAGEPIETKRISEALGITELEIIGAIDTLKNKYKDDSGIKLLYFGNCLQLSTNPIYKDQVEMMLNPIQKKSLSQASMEVLSIIAYKQPITRSEIEDIRGVKCDYSVMWLLQKGLIEEVGRKDTIGKPMLFGTTDIFLRQFGLSSLNELPKQELPLDLEEND
jgi:segregation and condensation protein B